MVAFCTYHLHRPLTSPRYRLSIAALERMSDGAELCVIRTDLRLRRPYGLLSSWRARRDRIILPAWPAS
ncbi:hypothetical protein NITLEN_10197 [Nitrospira lenta]|uniref:Uncharacterized protein n=1 Tax=Nitrospira lenta TaxID=1436998 RepID=A0A330L002_9BACT|nr:hypothetical protein NITLEN_10197 [Nitrospira lenta]